MNASACMHFGLAAVLAAACTTAAAQQRHVAVYGAIGTGIGAGAATPLTESLNLRFDFMLGHLNHDFSTETVDYRGKFKLRNVGAYLDWRPFNGTFRTSLGAIWAHTHADLVGTPRANGTFTIGNTTVNAAGESITATARMPTLRPYVGIGWGLADLTKPGFTWGVDLGVIFGRPRSDLQVSAGLAAVVPPTDIELERERLRNEVRKVRVEPVLKLSAGYVF